MIRKATVENDTDKAKNKSKSPNPIALKKDILSLNIEYRKIAKTSNKTNPIFIFTDV